MKRDLAEVLKESLTVAAVLAGIAALLMLSVAGCHGPIGSAVRDSEPTAQEVMQRVQSLSTDVERMATARDNDPTARELSARVQALRDDFAHMVAKDQSSLEVTMSMPEVVPSSSGVGVVPALATATVDPHWPGAFVKRGPIGSTLRGSVSDPETRIVGSTWHLWVSRSIGMRSRPVQSIEHTVSLDPLQGWGATDIALSGAGGAKAADPSGITQHRETPSVMQLPDGTWCMLTLCWPGLAPGGGRIDTIIEHTAPGPGGPWTYAGQARSAEFPWEGYWTQWVPSELGRPARSAIRGGPMEPALFTLAGQARSLFAGQAVWLGDGGTNPWGFRIGAMERVAPGLWRSLSNLPVIPRGKAGEWDSALVSHPCAEPHPQGGVIVAYAGGSGSTPNGIGLAWSADGVFGFVKHPGNPVLRPGTAGSWDAGNFGGPSLRWDPVGSRWVLHYHGENSFAWSDVQIGMAEAPAQ